MEKAWHRCLAFSLLFKGVEAIMKKVWLSVMMGALLVGCSSNEERAQEKPKTVQEQEMKEDAVKITEEDERSINQLLNQYVQTINENHFEEHMALYSPDAMNLDDTRAQKEAAFKRGNTEIELISIDIKKFEGDYAVVETVEKETENNKVVEKKVLYAVGKESDGWKVEDVQIID